MLTNNQAAIKPIILIFDSGVGGLSVYNEVKKTLPDACYLYAFDNEMFPYGNKSEKFIIDRVIAIINAMRKIYKFDLLIIACNTASTISLLTLRKYYPFPIIGVVPAIKQAAKLTHSGIIGLLATQATIECDYTNNLLIKFASNMQVLCLSKVELVKMAEDKLHGKKLLLSILRNLLSPWLRMPKPPDTIILGCTHFPLISEEIQTVLPKKTHLIHSGSAIARRTVWILKNNIYINNFREEKKINKAYCLSLNQEALRLIPALTSYGFESLEKISLQ